MNDSAASAGSGRHPVVGITLGDITGIGPEVTLKALAALSAPEPTDARASVDELAGPRFLILGDAGWFEATKRGIGLVNGQPGEPSVALLDPRIEPLPPTLEPGDPRAARAAVDWLRHGARLCLSGQLDALVTAPVNKQAIIEAGVAFVGQTEFLADLAGVPDPVMMLLGHDEQGRWLRVALATTHLAIRVVADILTPARIRRAITCAAEACRQLGLDRARVAVCGLNPHAGEGGHFGREEIEVIAPVVSSLRAAGVDAHGPFAADTLFHQAWRGEYDAVVAMYHDQGLAPLKLIAFDTGVNWTLGLPFIRTSPDHGTAYDLVGRHAARPDSMLAALRLAVQLARRRTVQFTDGSSGELASKA